MGKADYVLIGRDLNARVGNSHILEVFRMYSEECRNNNGINYHKLWV
jgi:hypothetical protein